MSIKHIKVQSANGVLYSYYEERGRTSLVDQWLRLHNPNEGGPNSIPGQGTKSRTLQLRIRTLQLRLGAAK